MHDERVWVNTPMSADMKTRIAKAAAKNNWTVAKYMRVALTAYMKENSEWSLPGPRKGAT